MSAKWYFNGSDYLMLGFDRELRVAGFAGYSCKMMLELGSAIAPETLRRRLAAVVKPYPLLNARPGGWVRPHWKLPRGTPQIPPVRVHPGTPGVEEKIFNEPLAINRGELLRFDLIERPGGRMDLIFTWAHALTDARGAEHLLAMIGREDVPLPAAEPPAPRYANLTLRQKLKMGWKAIHQLDEFCKVAPPRSLRPRQPDAPAHLRYRVEKFSAAETAQVRANGVRLSGLFGDAQYHAAVSVHELHRLHERLGCPSPSYVLPVPVGLRRKGSYEPLFGNQMAMLMLQFLPSHLDSPASAAAELKKQTEQCMRDGLLDSGIILSQLFRFLPLPLYMAMVKQGLRGEICSLFFGNTAGVDPLLTHFLGVPIEDFAHVGGVTPSPGVGVIFYYFKDLLRVTVVHSTKILSEPEAAEFAAGLRAHLLNP